MSYNHKKLLAEIPDETYAAKFLQKVGIIHSERLCCGKKMYPDDGAHTQTIERTWRSAKWRNKKHFGTHRQMIDSYLCEFLWREDAKRRGVDAFEDILAKIVDFMPPK